MTSNDNIELYLSLSDKNNNNTFNLDESNQNNHLSILRNSNKNLNKKIKKNNKRTTTIIEEPSIVVSNQSEAFENDIKNDNNKGIDPNKEEINDKRSPSIYSRQFMPKNKSFTDKKKRY